MFYPQAYRAKNWNCPIFTFGIAYGTLDVEDQHLAAPGVLRAAITERWPRGTEGFVDLKPADTDRRISRPPPETAQEKR